jgi:hypothetical protein
MVFLYRMERECVGRLLGEMMGFGVVITDSTQHAKPAFHCGCSGGEIKAWITSLNATELPAQHCAAMAPWKGPRDPRPKEWAGGEALSQKVGIHLLCTVYCYRDRL